MTTASSKRENSILCALSRCVLEKRPNIRALAPDEKQEGKEERIKQKKSILEEEEKRKPDRSC